MPPEPAAPPKLDQEKMESASTKDTEAATTLVMQPVTDAVEKAFQKVIEEITGPSTL